MRPLSVLFLVIAVAAARPVSAQEPIETTTAATSEIDADGAIVTEREPAPSRIEPSLLVTVNVPGARIIVDEDQPRVAPAAALRVSPGAHTVRVSAEGYLRSERSIQVPSEGARVDVFLEANEALAARTIANEDVYESTDDSGVHKKWWFWAAIGGGVVVVAGVIAAIALASGGGEGQALIPVPPIPGGP